MKRRQLNAVYCCSSLCAVFSPSLKLLFCIKHEPSTGSSTCNVSVSGLLSSWKNQTSAENCCAQAFYQLVARAFYVDYTTKSDNQQKSARRQWVREEDLAKELQLHVKQLGKIIRHFEEQKLIMRDHRKETAKGAKDV